MSRPIIEVQNLSKRYHLGAIGTTSLREETSRLWDRLRGIPHPDRKEFWALRDVSFAINAGEVVGVIGRNGAGKSTLLKILSRITEPTSGKATLRGRVASLLEVGTGFHPELTGRENVFLNGAILGMTRAEVQKKFDEIVAFAEVDQFIDTPVKRYSSGMYVRLAFAVAAHLEPEILIVDEVLAVGDAAFQKKCLGQMSTVASEGRTVLFVSHNMAMMKTLCQRALWLDRGTLIRAGESEAVVNAYFKSSANEPRAIIDLTDCARHSGDGAQLKICRLEWLGGLPLFHTEPMEVRIDFVMHAPVAKISLGIGFSSVEGVRLLTYETDDPGVSVDLDKGHQGNVSLTVESLPLPPGIYNIDIGARSGATKGIDYLPSCMQIEIVPGKKTQGHHAHGGAGVRLPSRWQWRGQPTTMMID